ncbi:MAG: hypothetical protein M3O28_01220, partial [Actinomycetota bacterium]|nr:hypothetical protein [Actinomycetota bacterium]
GVTTAAVCPESPAARLIDGAGDESTDLLRYVLPTPDRQLALLAEFTTPDGADDEVVERVESLMASFRWAS